MRERAMKHQLEAQQAANAYIREVASTTPADDIKKLSDLKDAGALSQEEFDQAKAKILSA
jgi:multidrug resistance efflux pump